MTLLRRLRPLFPLIRWVLAAATVVYMAVQIANSWAPLRSAECHMHGYS